MRHHDVPPRLIALVAILAGCGARTPLRDDDAGVAASAGACATTTTIVPRACFARSGSPPTGDIDLAIDVTVNGRGSDPSCFGFAQPGAVTSSYYLIGTDGLGYNLVMEGGANTLPALAFGSRVRVEFRRRATLFAASSERLTVSDERGMRAQFFTDTNLSTLPRLDGVAVERGALFCVSSDSCKTTNRFSLRVSTDGVVEEVPPDAPRDVGAYRVFHAGVEEATPTGACTDCCSGSVSLVVVRR